MRATTLLLSALMTASLQAQTFCKTEQFNLGQLLPTDSVSFKIEYPEYERLSRKTIDELRKQGFEAEDQVQFYINRGISRGETIVDVAYTPIVKRRGEWFAIKQYDLKPIVHNKGIKATYLRAAIKGTLSTFILTHFPSAKTELSAYRCALSVNEWSTKEGRVYWSL